MGNRKPRLLYFGPMSPAVLNGQKTTIRVPWASRRRVAFRPGEMVPGYDQRPGRGGKQIATLRITASPYGMNSADLTEEDYERDGFRYLERVGGTFGLQQPRDYWDAAKAAKADICVVQFEVIDVLVSDLDSVDTSEDPEGLSAIGLQFQKPALSPV